MFNDTFEFQLSNSLTFQSQNGEEATDTINMKPPMGKHEKIITQIQQQFAKAVIQARKAFSSEDDDNNDDSNKKISSNEICMVLQASNIDFYSFKKLFYSLVVNGVATVGDDIKVTTSMLDKISLDDKDRMVGEYIENFTLPSWMGQKQES